MNLLIETTLVLISICCLIYIVNFVCELIDVIQRPWGYSR